MLNQPGRTAKPSPRNTLPKGLRPGNHQRQSRASMEGVELSRTRRLRRIADSLPAPSSPRHVYVDVPLLLSEFSATMKTCGHKPHSVLAIATLMALVESHADEVKLLRQSDGKRLERLARQAAGSQKGSTHTLLQAAVSIIGAGHDEDGTIAARHLEAGLRRSHSFQPKAGWMSCVSALQDKTPTGFLQQF